MTTHALKIWPTPFRDLQEGHLTFQVRQDDRDYRSGDVLVLKEFEPVEGEPTMSLHPEGRFTGQEIRRQVNRVFRNLPGVVAGYIVMTLSVVVER